VLRGLFGRNQDPASDLSNCGRSATSSPGRPVRVEEIADSGMGYAAAARATQAYSAVMSTLKRIAPVFPVRNLRSSIAYYERLGFSVREYEGGGYALATRDGVEIHLGMVPEGDPGTIRSTAYIWVDDADKLAEAWRLAGADVRLPEDTDWGQHEGVVIDPDGNIIRFGSPIGQAGTTE
jgi:catechol 2,3-dioxygenase-like lactoylglutathione lyase family enzyme